MRFPFGSRAENEYGSGVTFNDDSNISNPRVKRRGRTTAVAAGGGGLLVLILAIAGPLLGIDLGPFAGVLGGGAPTGSSSDSGAVLSECTTGADANSRDDCRVQGAVTSLDSFWAAAAPDLGIEFRPSNAVLFTDATETGCGAASSATGPFYCPPDETLYLDTAFFDELSSRFGANDQPLAKMYVVAHEYGHHIQQIGGIFDGKNRTDTGPSSDSVRLEVQADCFAGAWVRDASTTKDAQGNTFLQQVTRQQVTDALSAASAVGDDRIQQSAGGGVNPETWTHGSAEQRQRWFTAGYEGGPAACDTFAVGADQL